VTQEPCEQCVKLISAQVWPVLRTSPSIWVAIGRLAEVLPEEPVNYGLAGKRS